MTCNQPHYNITGVASGCTYKTGAFIGSNNCTQDASTGSPAYLGWGNYLNNFSNSTGKFTIGVAGYYQINLFFFKQIVFLHYTFEV